MCAVRVHRRVLRQFLNKVFSQRPRLYLLKRSAAR